MCPPPAVARQESPSEILARLRAELLEVATLDVNRDDTRRLGDDLRDRQIVAEAEPERGADTKRKNAQHEGHIQTDPVPDGHEVITEVGANRQLVAERERNRKVRVEMQESPG